MDSRSLEHRWLVRLVWLVPLGMLALALLLEPDARGYGTHEQIGLPPCALRGWLGAPCPACGVTTAATEVAQGHPLRAFRVQPFGAALALGALVLFAWVLWAHRRGIDTWQVLMERVRLRWVLALALLGWLWRIVVERP